MKRIRGKLRRAATEVGCIALILLAVAVIIPLAGLSREFVVIWSGEE